MSTGENKTNLFSFHLSLLTVSQWICGHMAHSDHTKGRNISNGVAAPAESALMKLWLLNVLRCHSFMLCVPGYQTDVDYQQLNI